MLVILALVALLQIHGSRGIECFFCVDEKMLTPSFVFEEPTDDVAITTVSTATPLPTAPPGLTLAPQTFPPTTPSGQTETLPPQPPTRPMSLIPLPPPNNTGIKLPPVCDKNGREKREHVIECPVQATACFRVVGKEVRQDRGNGSLWEVRRKGCWFPPVGTLVGTSLEEQGVVGKCVMGNTTDREKTGIFEAQVCICNGERPHVEPDVEAGDEPYTERSPRMPCNGGTRINIGSNEVGVILFVAAAVSVFARGTGSR